MDNTEIRQIILRVNGEDASKNIKKLEAQLKAATEQKEQLEASKNAAGSKWTEKERKNYQFLTKEIKATERSLRRAKAGADEMGDTLDNLKGTNLKELQRTLRGLEGTLNSGRVKRGSKEWDQLTGAMRRVKAEIKKVKDEQSAYVSTGQRLKDMGNEWMGIVTNVQAAMQAITGMRQIVKKSVEDYAEMEESMANTRKYTGLNDKGVRELNDALRSIDTRTSREELNALAGDAGKLGITSKEQILDFVDAADKINVALGDDLGEGAVKNVGKLAMMFGEDQRLGLKQAMLATASVINELSQNSSAGAGYLEEFTARVAGVGKQAGLTQAQIMGFASVLDENMQQDETSATAFSQLITKMYQEPAKFAALAGKDVREFSQLLKTDANAALTTFFSSMQAQGSFDQLAPMFEKMGLDGTRATAVLTTIADKIQDVQARQQLANEAYRDATSINREFSVQNNTVQAGLEKARKAAKEMRVELGEKLAPAAKHLISFSSLSMRALSQLITYVSQNAKLIVTLATTTATYAVVANLAAIKVRLWYVAEVGKNKVMTAWNILAATAQAAMLMLTIAYARLTGNAVLLRAAQMKLNATMLANPYAAVLTAIVAIAAAIYLWATRERQLTTEQKARKAAMEACNEAMTKANQSEQLTARRIEALRAIIRDNSRSLRDRRAAIAELQKIVPAYQASLSAEGVLTERNTKAINDYLTQLKRKALAEALYEKLVEAMKKKANAEIAAQGWDNAIENRKNKLNNDPKYASHQVTIWGVQGSAQGSDELNKFRKQMKESVEHAEKRKKWWDDEVKAAEIQINRITAYAQQQGAEGQLNNLIASGGSSASTPSSVGTSEGRTSGGGAAGGSGNNPQLDAIEKDAKARQAALIAQYENEEITERKYQAESMAIELDTLLKKQKIYKEGTAEWYELAVQISERRIDAEEKMRDWQLQDIERDTAIMRISAETAFRAGETTQRQHDEELLDIQEQDIQRRQKLYEEGSDEWMDLEEQRLKNHEELQKMYDERNLAAINEQEREERDAAQQAYIDGELDEEQYQKRLLEIKLRYLRRREAYYRQEGNVEKAAEAKRAADEEDNAQRLKRHEEYLRKAKQLQNEYEKKSIDEREKDELRLLDELVKASVISEEKKEEYAKQIIEKYNKEREDKEKNKQSPLGRAEGWGGDFVSIIEAMDKLSKKIKEGKATWQDYAAVANASLQMVGNIASGVGNFFQAQQAEQEAAVNKRYDAEIKKAGSNSKKGKRLEEQKQKELARLKQKYNKKQMKVEMAQAVAQTAVAALNAFSSASKVAFWLGPIAAAAALAYGALQIATIKKQHAAEEMGYYEGGFTGGRNFRQEAGVVHEGEFVANHRAVENPALMPVLRLIDRAQRSNTVASLTARDVSRVISAPAMAAADTRRVAEAAPVIAAHVKEPQQTEAIRRLLELLDEGIKAYVVLSGPDGLDRMWSKYRKLVDK